ncbi:MAG: hypothetical protein R2939_05850 [Kofleriaceae bacterium]
MVAPHRSTAISHLAEEIVVHANRAYERCRHALVVGGDAAVVAANLVPPRGWILGVDAAEAAAAVEPAPLTAPVAERRRRASSVTFATTGALEDDAELEVTVEATPEVEASAGGDGFERRARALLGDGRAGEARELLATALCVYPRSKPLRGLYHVATAVVALADAQPALAIAQLEAALGQDAERGEAGALLELVRAGAPSPAAVRKVFR